MLSINCKNSVFIIFMFEILSNRQLTASLILCKKVQTVNQPFVKIHLYNE